jgi:hypothetical protein
MFIVLVSYSGFSIIKSTRKNSLHLLSFRCFCQYDESSMNYKLILIQFSDTFLLLISTSTHSNHIKFITYKLEVSHYYHACNC